MTPSIPKRLVVELDYDGDGNIAGRVLRTEPAESPRPAEVHDDAASHHRDFAGWLGLAAAIEQLAAAQGREAA